MSVVAKNVQRILDERCIKQSKFAERYGIGVKTFNGLLRGRTPMKESHIIMIANALAVKPSELFKGYEEAVVSNALTRKEKTQTGRDT
jgi:transcriptional regulator with XRE-family HTH domain